MGYFDGFTANLFRFTKEGDRMIAPFGSLGNVYMVPRDSDAARIVRAVRRMYQLMLVVIVVPLVVFGWRWSLAFAALWLAAFYCVMHLATRKLPQAGLKVRDLSRVSRAEMVAKAGRAVGLGWLTACLVASVGFMATGIWLWSQDRSMPYVTVLFALFAASFAYQIIVSRRAPRISRPDTTDD